MLVLLQWVQGFGYNFCSHDDYLDAPSCQGRCSLGYGLVQQFYSHFSNVDFVASLSTNEVVLLLSEPLWVHQERMPSTLTGL